MPCREARGRIVGAVVALSIALQTLGGIRQRVPSMDEQSSPACCVRDDAFTLENSIHDPAKTILKGRFPPLGLGCVNAKGMGRAGKCGSIGGLYRLPHGCVAGIVSQTVSEGAVDQPRKSNLLPITEGLRP